MPCEQWLVGQVRKGSIDKAGFITCPESSGLHWLVGHVRKGSIDKAGFITCPVSSGTSV